MPDRHEKRRMLQRLQNVRDKLALAKPDPNRPRSHTAGLDDDEPTSASAGADRESSSAVSICAVCGYDLAGQTVDRCPECGLILAKGYKDPTDWFREDQNLINWGRTTLRILSWDRRTRIRTSFIPISRQSFRFALIAIALTSPILGGIGYHICSSGFGSVSAFDVILTVVLISAAVAILLVGLLFVLRILLTGQWQKKSFLPASIHYAAAWWPVAGLLAAATYLVGQATHAAGTSEFKLMAYITILVGVGMWAGWLSDSMQLSGRVPRVEIRLAAIGVTVWLLGPSALWFVSATVTQGASQAVAGAQATAQRLFGKPAAKPAETHALVVNLTNTESDGLLLDRLCLLGVKPSHLTYFDRSEATLQAVEAVLGGYRTNLDARDQVVVWLRADAEDVTKAAIEMAGETLSGERLAELIGPLPTVDRLVVADFPDADRFLEPLRDSRDGVLLWPQEDSTSLYKLDVPRVWEALGLADADTNGDANVTLAEAYAFVESWANTNTVSLVDVSMEEVGKSRADRFAAQLPNRGDGLKPLPQTFVLIADAGDGSDSVQARAALSKLATGHLSVAEIMGDRCTPNTIKGAIKEAASWLAPQDKFIMYLRGASSADWDGIADLTDEYLCAGCLVQEFEGFPTDNVLVIYGTSVSPEYLNYTTDEQSVIQVAATQPYIVPDYFYSFWNAFQNKATDSDVDSRITITEAMIQAAVGIQDLARGSAPVRMIVHGKADPGRFYAKSPKPKTKSAPR